MEASLLPEGQAEGGRQPTLAGSALASVLYHLRLPARVQVAATAGGIEEALAKAQIAVADGSPHPPLSLAHGRTPACSWPGTRSELGADLAVWGGGAGRLSDAVVAVEAVGDARAAVVLAPWLAAAQQRATVEQARPIPCRSRHHLN
jgi:hypothetical protein